MQHPHKIIVKSFYVDTNVFELVPPSDANKFWSIAASAPLERERQTNTVDIRCTIVDTSGTIKEIDKNDVFIEILDDDNHPPVPQDEEIHVKMHSNFVNKVRLDKINYIILIFLELKIYRVYII